MNMLQFTHPILHSAPRILGLTDRDEHSQTYGCSERSYWKYKFHDFPNARFQESALFLALLYSTAFEGNLFFGKGKVAQWALASCGFWLKNRNKDGSVAEAYPFERSFCGTSFSTWHVCLALRTLQKTTMAKTVDDFIAQTDFLSRIHTTANWLTSSIHMKTANQAAGAALSLELIAQLTGEAQYSHTAQEIIKELLLLHDRVGFFSEYGGFDLGYSTITLSCLTWYAEVTKQGSDFEGKLISICSGLSKKLSNNGWFDSTTMSRGTGFIYPHAFARYSPEGIEKLKRGLDESTLLSPTWMDDRYCIPLSVDYIKTINVFGELA